MTTVPGTRRLTPIHRLVWAIAIVAIPAAGPAVAQHASLSRPRSSSVAAPSPVPAVSCVACDLLYVSDCDFGLWAIDTLTLSASFIGVTPDYMFDVAALPDGRLFGSDSSNRLWQLSACDATGVIVGLAGGNGLGAGGLLLAPVAPPVPPRPPKRPGSPTSSSSATFAPLFAQGPPLVHIESSAPFMQTTVGGDFGPTPPNWCGVSSGDLALDPTGTTLYSTLACLDCPGDKLVRLSPTTGEVIAEVGCIRDASGAGFEGIWGLAFDSYGSLWGAGPTLPAAIVSIDPTTAVATVFPVTGGYVCATGIALLPCAR